MESGRGYYYLDQQVSEMTREALIEAVVWLGTALQKSTRDHVESLSFLAEIDEARDRILGQLRCSTSRRRD